MLNKGGREVVLYLSAFFPIFFQPVLPSPYCLFREGALFQLYHGLALTIEQISLFINLFIQIFIKLIPNDRHNGNRTDKIPCPPVAYILVRDDR